ncbi:hypothetical protein SERLADRAFT_378812 [Serpula lacrymans var. lacrymans S7.9]|uniref:Uncharacterized protein n=1 Tax=Serpula lacrymans var. lacrymans (strain S7.9) TaxID=578457 RepID=F8NH02_SERL9|nr:uncharacterized protein SERLADRAFT_378812 [Serpula lacrymans var. lacrymans S7.9]EGO29644.1 hypothetical protein SERLADRAFT_378812 [Serpula lacrymans var. lacrymans S7.9]
MDLLDPHRELQMYKQPRLKSPARLQPADRVVNDVQGCFVRQNHSTWEQCGGACSYEVTWKRGESS